MATNRTTERLQATDPADIAHAAQLLRSGHTVAFPTETVYGLGADALDPAAVAKIFAAKRRPSWDPLIVHIVHRDQVAAIGFADPVAVRLMDAFWPGPLTLLLPRTAAIPDAVTAGRALVGVRMPAHPVALALLGQAGIPIAAPSANTFGHTSPTTAQHVLDDLDGRIDAIVDGGPTSVGLESTVVAVTGQGVRIYRPGAIDVAMLETVVDSVEIYVAGERSSVRPEALPSPGVGMRHYAPRARLIVHSQVTREPLERSLIDAVDEAHSDGGRVAVMLPDGWHRGAAQLSYRWGPWEQPEVLAQRLYDGLRQLDDEGATIILCPLPTAFGIGEALRDRLQKAARREDDPS